MKFDDFITESKKSNIRFQTINSIFSSVNNNQNNYNSDNSINLKLVHDYTELFNQGSNYLLINKFEESLSAFKESLSIAEKLRDPFKKTESKCNIGITNFYLGKLNESIDWIQPSYEYIKSICSHEKGMNTIKNIYLLCKCGANLCMCHVTLNSENNSYLQIINNIINIISQEEDLYKQLFFINYLNNILFRVNSLLKNSSSYLNNISKYENDLKNNDMINLSNEEEYNKIYQLFIESFDAFIATQKIEQWIKSLNIIYKKLEKLNDTSGLIYILFNQQLSICSKNNNESNINEEVNKAKTKLISLLEAIDDVTNNNNDNFNNIEDDNNGNMKQAISDEYINNIIEGYKSKLLAIRNIYQRMHSFEEQITLKIQKQNMNSLNQNKGPTNIIANNNINYNIENFIGNINGQYFLMLLLKYSINYFEENIEDIELKNELINDIKVTLNLINSKQIDLSKIKLSSIDPEIFSSLSLIINRLFTIYKINKFRKYFKIYKKNISNTNLNKNLNKEKSKTSNLKEFFEKQYKYIYNGQLIKKMNYNSSGVKRHFYQIDNEEDLFEAFSENQNEKKPEKIYKFDNILKIQYGIKTKNAIDKVKNLNSVKKKEPYLFLSLILKNRTIDLYFDKEKIAKKWFYGFYYYLKRSGRKYKIGSCTNYILFRLKCKMINKLDEDTKKINRIPFCALLEKYYNTFE